MVIIDPETAAKPITDEKIVALEIIIPFAVHGQMVNFKLICPKCASTFWMISDDYQMISCHNTECDCVPLVQPVSYGDGIPMWKI